MKITYLYCILTVLLLSSCHGKRLVTKNFIRIESFSELNGRYVSEDNKLNKAFNKDCHSYYICKAQDCNDEIGVFELEFKSKDSLIVFYVDDVGRQTLRLKGKKKKNFFEIYFQNRRIYLPPFLILNNINRVRIGKNIDGKLLVYRWVENHGMIMPLGAGGQASDEIQLIFEYYDKNIKDGLYSIKINNKWGYANSEDSIVIKPTYDFAHPFNNNVAKVECEGKWGYIDTNNNQIISITYDTIMTPRDGIMRVCKNGKWGLIHFQEGEIIPMKYDEIHPFGYHEYNDTLFFNLARVKNEGKVGYINRQGIEVIPVEYDDITLYPYYWGGQNKCFRSRIGDKYGYVNGNGVVCKPIFDKAGKRLYYSGLGDDNKILTNCIGKYSEVIYKGDPYLFTDKGMLFKYKKMSIFRGFRIEIERNSAIYVNKLDD